MSCEYVTHTTLFSNNQSITSLKKENSCWERIQTWANLVVEGNTILYDVPISLTEMVIKAFHSHTSLCSSLSYKLIPFHRKYSIRVVLGPYMNMNMSPLI